MEKEKTRIMADQDRDDVQSEWERQQQEREEANRQFSDSIWGTKDALEHMALEATFQGLMMRGFLGDFSGLRDIKHRTNCPSCQLIRDAKRPEPNPLVAGMTGQGSGIFQPRGIRIPK